MRFTSCKIRHYPTIYKTQDFTLTHKALCFEPRAMENELSEMDSWNTLPGPLILSDNVFSTDESQDIKPDANAEPVETPPLELMTLLRNMGTKNRKLYHFATPHTGGMSCDHSLCRELKVRDKSNVRLFASQNVHPKNPSENVMNDAHQKFLLYQSREVVFESHWPPSRKRGCDQEHNKQIRYLEDALANEMNTFTGSMSALLSL